MDNRKKEEDNEQLLPVDGILYNLYDFIDLCSSGSLIDRGGTGYYSDGRVFWLDQEAIPSKIVAGKIRFDYKYRYVIWFERDAWRLNID